MKKKIEEINIDFDYIDFSKLFACSLSSKFTYKEKIIIKKINEIIREINKVKLGDDK